MNKKRYFYRMFLSFALLMTIPTTFTHAKDYPVNQSDNTTVEIRIKEPIIGIEVLQSPDFGTHTVSDNEQLVSSEKDLIIQVRDDDQLGNWKLNYDLSYFRLSNDTVLTKESAVTIQKGKLYGYDANGKLVYIKEQTKPIDGKGILVENQSNDYTKYQYRVKKDDIEMLIPANPKVGDYVAIQTVILEATPNY
ncbi:hypothetical protein D6T70_13505 [Kurthia gibsonii]|uniref:hypothetical protein n=1 Tax=Kurthia gibsonii TaxID=33946 RepID=UPI000B3F0DA6|nr:hypothetical protein [Kurthia gibsonii]RXH51083.1 hypothetical protein D6T70_13505 [Kurthia gibsonii]